VPEDFQSILNDPSFFNNSSEITTKEILKRYGEIAANGGLRRQNTGSQSPLGRSKQGSGRAIAPAITRVDTDPSQANAWKKESSVRHVQDPSAPHAGNPNQHTPQQQQWQGADLEHPSPYSQRAGTPDSQVESGGRRDWRNSGWGRHQNGNGSMGVTGAN
jgi:hypothetical protein